MGSVQRRGKTCQSPGYGSGPLEFNHRAAFETVLEELELTADDVCLVGSVALYAAGIRENADVDFVVDPAARERIRELVRDHPEYEQKPNGGFQLGEYVEIPMPEKISVVGLREADLVDDPNYHAVRDGLKIIGLDVETALKMARWEPKQREDLAEIRAGGHLEAGGWDWEPNVPGFRFRPVRRFKYLQLKALWLRNDVRHGGFEYAVEKYAGKVRNAVLGNRRVRDSEAVGEV